MTLLRRLRRFRSPIIAVLGVILSAGIAMAGQPASPGASGLATAGVHAGKTVPIGSSPSQSGKDEASGDAAESNESSDPTDSANTCNVDLTGDLSSFSHGQIVCTAAQQSTPSGYANHGAWVSHWAKMNHGAGASATGQGHKPSH